MALPVFVGQTFQDDGTTGTIVRQANALMGALRTFLKRLSDNTALDYVELSATLTGGVDSVVNHKLGRVPQAWQIVDTNAAATVFRNAAFSSTTITLRASVTCTVKLRIW